MNQEREFPIRRNSSSIVQAGLLALLACFGSSGLAQPGGTSCGTPQVFYGPYDYRTDKDKLPLVERAHFTPAVEALIRGESGTTFGPDIDYTLRHIPNHHRALLAAVRAGERAKSENPPTLPASIPCYFERALRFRPDDVLVHMIYAKHLAENRHEPEARRQLAVAADLGREDGLSQYNIGLIYFDMKAYPEALQQAHKVRALGYPTKLLEEQLKKVGKWTEPEVDAAASAPKAESKATP